MTKRTKKNATVKKQGNARKLVWDAATEGDWEAVKEWLQSDPSLITATGWMSDCADSTLLHIALVHRLDIDSIKYLIRLGANVNAKNDCGDMPLYMTNNVKMLEYLVSQGANVHAVNAYDQTLLHHAADHYRNVNVLEYLIAQGVDTDAQDRWGKIPLDYADTEEKKRLLRRAMTAD